MRLIISSAKIVSVSKALEGPSLWIDHAFQFPGNMNHHFQPTHLLVKFLSTCFDLLDKGIGFPNRLFWSTWHHVEPGRAYGYTLEQAQLNKLLDQKIRPMYSPRILNIARNQSSEGWALVWLGIAQWPAPLLNS